MSTSKFKDFDTIVNSPSQFQNYSIQFSCEQDVWGYPSFLRIRTTTNKTDQYQQNKFFPIQIFTVVGNLSFRKSAHRFVIHTWRDVLIGQEVSCTTNEQPLIYLLSQQQPCVLITSLKALYYEKWNEMTNMKSYKQGRMFQNY